MEFQGLTESETEVQAALQQSLMTCSNADLLPVFFPCFFPSFFCLWNAQNSFQKRSLIRI